MDGTTLSDWEKSQEKPIDLAAMDEMISELVALKLVKEKIELELKEQTDLYEKKKDKVLSVLKNAGKKSYKVDGLANVIITQTPQVKMPKGLTEKEEFFSYLRDKGIFTEMVSVHSQTLNSWYKTEFENYANSGKIGFKIPGLEEPTVRESLSIRKDTKK